VLDDSVQIAKAAKARLRKDELQKQRSKEYFEALEKANKLRTRL
jgi:hypothetical protein